MRAWLSTIAINKCRDHARRRAVRRFLAFAAPIDRQAESVPDDRVPVDVAAADRQELEQVWRAIATLPSKP